MLTRLLKYHVRSGNGSGLVSWVWLMYCGGHGVDCDGGGMVDVEGRSRGRRQQVELEW